MVWGVVSPMMFASILMVVSGTIFSVSSGELVGVWVGMEVNLYGFLVLMNPDGKSVPEPCVKYFVIQSAGSIMLLAGFIMIKEYSSMLGYMVWVSGVALKSGIFPLHSWVPSIMKNCNWGASGLILTWQKLAPLVMLCVFLPLSVIWVVASLMAIVGGVGGLNQNTVRTMSAYSSFVHNSWMLVALKSFTSVFLLYFVVYSLSVMLFFYSCFLSNKEGVTSRVNSAVGSMGLLMLSGMPPFLGFIAKVVVFLSVESILLFFCIFGSVVSLKYYIDFFYSMLFGGKLDKQVLGVSKMWLGGLLLNFMGFLVTLVMFI